MGCFTNNRAVCSIGKGGVRNKYMLFWIQQDVSLFRTIDDYTILALIKQMPVRPINAHFESVEQTLFYRIRYVS